MGVLREIVEQPSELWTQTLTQTTRVRFKTGNKRRASPGEMRDRSPKRETRVKMDIPGAYHGP